MNFSPEDDAMMLRALELAREAAAAGEVPIGAVASVGGRLTASARNRVEACHSVTAHAEIELLHELERLRGDWRMDDVTIYVSKEPCAMCAGALVNARVGRIVFGLPDPRCGGCGSALDVTGHPGMLWHPGVAGGLRADEAGAIIREFFRKVRRSD